MPNDPWDEEAAKFKPSSNAPASATAEPDENDYSVWNKTKGGGDSGDRPGGAQWSSSVADTLGTIGSHAANIVTGPIQAVMHPYDTFVKPTVDAGSRAISQFKQGQYSDAARSAESAIPIVGPWADNIENEVAQKGAVAGMAGLATDILGAKAAAAAPEAIKSTSRFARNIRPASDPNIVSPAETSARNLTDAIAPDLKRAPAYRKAAQVEVPNIIDYAKRTNNPLNTQLEFSKAAEGNAQEARAHYEDKVLGPNANHQIPAPAGSEVQSMPAGENTQNRVTTLRNVDKRIIDINKDLENPKLNAGDQRAASDSELLAEKAQLADILHRSLSNLTGIAPEDIADLRQRVGRSRELANDTDAAVTKRGLSDARPGELPVHKSGILTKAVNEARGGEQAIADRAFQKAIKDFPGQAKPLPQVTGPKPAAGPNSGLSRFQRLQNAQRQVQAQGGPASTVQPEKKTFDGKSSVAAAIPEAVTDLLHRTGAKITHNESPNSKVVASVDPAEPNNINIDDMERFSKDKNAANQTLTHEAVHIWHNNLPPEIQKMIPADDPKDPYHKNGYEPDELQNMRAQGLKAYNLPRERYATVMQKYSHLGGDDAPKEVRDVYGPWAQDMRDTPLSTVMPTKGSQPGIETAMRPPGSAPMPEMSIFPEEKGEEKKEKSEGNSAKPEGKTKHPAGDITGFDEETGLPIVKRKSETKEAKPEPKARKPEPKPEPKEDVPAPKSTSKGDGESEQAKAPEKSGAASSLKVGDRATLPDGKMGTVTYIPSKNSQLPTYRFKSEDGKKIELRASQMGKVKPAEESKTPPPGYTTVTTHVRKLPNR